MGRALDWEVLREAGIERADAFVASTDGDNTNIVIAQIAQKKYGIRCVVARVYDPLRAELFAQVGIRTVCPTRTPACLLRCGPSIPLLTERAERPCSCSDSGRRQGRLSTCRSLVRLGHDVLVVEQRKTR